MAVSNRERIGVAMDQLQAGINPYIEREMRAYYQDAWLHEVASILPRQQVHSDNSQMDVQVLLQIMWFRWNEVFGQKLSHAERSIVSELRTARNNWAHQQPFSTDDTYRTLDSIERLLTAVGAPEATEVQQAKMEVLRTRFEEQARTVRRRTASTAIEGRPAGGLPAWRNLVTPHPDVAAGRFQQAEFAADLAQVHRGDGVDEYRNPVEFFRRTYITDGLRQMLVNALRRLGTTGEGGDPVVKLQTNFGGGKTHSMLALFHLFSGTDAAQLPGLEDVLREAGVSQPPTARRAVLVGTALDVGAARRKDDGTLVHTLWGELAWQLLGREGYAIVAEHDANGTNPGSTVLRNLFMAAQPALILIDEWVAFIRNTWNVERVPAGTFDNNLSFAQSLTEAARAVPNVLVVASLPASDIEVGGSAGKEALQRLENTFGRVETVWKPASAQEGFEIVRRRLFEPIPAARIPERDTVIRAFIDAYRQHTSEFPSGVVEADYERQMRAAYPIHPELFERLYEDWSQLERFQRTRGVLRLMAAVIHALWEREDHNLMIMPATIPIDDPAVQYELTRYLEDQWQPIIEKDVDGPNALPREIDNAFAGTLGRFSATRRVARTVYIGSAPTGGAANRGIDDRHIRLGCIQPGETIATFGDALRRLANDATYLYTDGGRYWYSTTPTVNRLAQDRATQQRDDDVIDEIRERLRQEGTPRGHFARVHVAPRTTGDVPDEDEVRLVILDPEHAHTRGTDSPARRAAQELLDSRGNSPRLNRNMLLFLAADSKVLDSLRVAVRELRAWRSIEDEADTLNLDTFQRNQAKTKRAQAESAVKERIPETYQWLLVPSQQPGASGIEWSEGTIKGTGSLAERASRKAINDDALVAETYGHALLRMELDRIPLWRGDDVSVRQLWEDYCRYLYLPRLANERLLLQAVQSGIGQMFWNAETWAYAQRRDDSGRYHGLTIAMGSGVTMDGQSVVVRPEAAQRQFEADRVAEVERAARAGGVAYDAAQQDQLTTAAQGTSAHAPGIAASAAPPAAAAATPKVMRRFYGSVDIDTLKTSSSVAQVVNEVIQHLTGLPGASVRITLEVEASLPNGVPEHTVRTVTENARTLKFSTHEFDVS